MGYKIKRASESSKFGVIQYPPPKIVHSSECANYKSKNFSVCEGCKKLDCYLSPCNTIIPFDKSYLDLNCGLALQDALNHLNVSHDLISFAINALSESLIECLNSKKFKICNDTSRGKWKVSGSLDNFKFENGVWLLYTSDCHLSNGSITLLSQKLKIKIFTIEE